jgi:signal transduction histidine kinase
MRFPAPPEVDVTIECPKDLPRVYADPRQMIQVLGNLTLNACQSMLAPGLNKSARVRHLSLYSSLQDDMIKIIVKDSGEGIPAENMKKIFEPLFTTKPKGVGLGLPVSQKLVEANGGRIEVQSEPGTGSTFSVYLPIYKEPQ